MFNWFNATKTITTKNNLKVKVQIEVEFEESVGKLITGGLKKFQFNTDKKTIITASISPLKSTNIISGLYKIISQVVVKEFNLERNALNDPKKIIVEAKNYKIEIMIFNVITDPKKTLDKIIEELYKSDIELEGKDGEIEHRLIEKDVRRISQRANVSEDIARKALEESDGNMNWAIKILENKKWMKSLENTKKIAKERRKVREAKRIEEQKKRIEEQKAGLEAQQDASDKAYERMKRRAKKKLQNENEKHFQPKNIDKKNEAPSPSKQKIKEFNDTAEKWYDKPEFRGNEKNDKNFWGQLTEVGMGLAILFIAAVFLAMVVEIGLLGALAGFIFSFVMLLLGVVLLNK